MKKIVPMMFVLLLLAACSSFSIDQAQELIQTQIPAISDIAVKDISRDGDFRVVAADVSYNGMQTAHMFKCLKSDTGWSIQQVRMDNGAWITLDMFKRRLERQAKTEEPEETKIEEVEE